MRACGYACVHVCMRAYVCVNGAHMDAHVDAACVRMLANVHVCMLPKIITRYCGGHVVRVLPKNQLGRQCHSSFLNPTISVVSRDFLRTSFAISRAQKCTAFT